MTIYIALLRGINVGGHNVIKMIDLKNLFISIGLFDAKTYIQSGNVLFKSNEDEDTLRRKIELEILKIFNFHVKVVLRTLPELEQIIENSPYKETEISKARMTSIGECFYVALLLHLPSEDKIQ